MRRPETYLLPDDVPIIFHRKTIPHFEIVLAIMVNRGRSHGCVTCKQRRVKCDEAKPTCYACRRLDLQCGGYKAKPIDLKFKDENHKFQEKIKIADQSVLAPSPRSVSEPDTSVPFFLGHYAKMGRRMDSARGFFEVLIPVYYSQPQDSPISLAITALGGGILSLWQYGANGFQRGQKSYAQAVARVRSAIQDPMERANPATVMAILALQFYENIAAVYDLRWATRTHHNGALSLLPFVSSANTDGLVSSYVRRYVFHTEIASAMRQKKSQKILVSSLLTSMDLGNAPQNPSSVLDAIGATVAEFHAKYKDMQQEVGTDPTSPLEQFQWEWIAEAQHIEERLLIWAENVPESWLPTRLNSGTDFDSSIPTYQSICEIYPSCQIASIWNLWRIQRLLLVKIILTSLNQILLSDQFELTEEQVLVTMHDIIDYKIVLQDLVDSMCYSVPFFIGNLNKPLNLANFTDPTVLLPSYESLAIDDKRRLRQEIDNPSRPKYESRSHIIAQGTWQVMNPLSRLLLFLSEDEGQDMANFLRPGQHEWIREQFLRVTTLLHLPSGDSYDASDGFKSLNSTSRMFTEKRAEYLARAIRKGAIFMSGF